MSSKRKRRIIVYGSVTRYGPQSVCQRKWLNRCLQRSGKVILRIEYYSVLFIYG